MKKKKRKPVWEEEELSQEEKSYRYACELKDSLECVLRFERRVASLQGAARIFQELGEYKDSPEQQRQCEEQAIKEQEEGIRKTYENAVLLEEAATSKLDYKTVLGEYGRIPEYQDVPERILQCKKKLVQLDSRTVWRNRGIAAAILLVLFAVFWVSPAQPYAKGLVHKHQGKYALAILNFQETNGFINSQAMIRSCRYQQALKAYERGNMGKALQLCRKAAGNTKADKLAARIELADLSAEEKELGDIVEFGTKEWILLDRSKDKVLLLLAGDYRQHIYDNGDGNTWENTWIRRWLHKKFRENVFNSGEKKLLIPVDNDPSQDKTDKVFLLSQEEYEKYQSILRFSAEWGEWYKGEWYPVTDAWWLRSPEAGTEVWVDREGKVVVEQAAGKEGASGDSQEVKVVRPAVWVSLDEGLLEDAPTIQKAET